MPRPFALATKLLQVGTLGVAFAAVSCPGQPDAGQFGKIRFVGKVRGEVPLPLLPPVADPSGNIYSLYGRVDFPEVNVFTSFVGGGEQAGCPGYYPPSATPGLAYGITKGDKYGPHGFIGFAQDRYWYWSGDALVQVSGTQHACAQILDRDPGTDASLLFRAVLPWVRDAPSRVTTVAFVQTSVDPLPYSVLVDLNASFLTNVQVFQPSDATDVQFIGVGGDRDNNVGEAVVQYKRGGNGVLEARFFDAGANPTATVPIAGPTNLPPYSVVGYLQRSSNGLVVGLLDTHDTDETKRYRLITFDRSGGVVSDPIGGLTPVGVHVWEGNLYLVGTNQGHPVIAPIDDRGKPGAVVTWAASERATAALKMPLAITDDRTLPSRPTTWSAGRSAMGDFVFLSPFPLTRHAPGTTLWLIGGPQVDIGGGKQTSFGMAPVGVSYP